MKNGAILKHLIKDAGLTQKRFAEVLGVAPSTLNGYIISEREPDLQLLLAMANVLNVTVDEIIGEPTVNTNRYILTDDESALIERYRATDNNKRQSILDFAEFIVQKSKTQS